MGFCSNNIPLSFILHYEWRISTICSAISIHLLQNYQFVELNYEFTNDLNHELMNE